MKIGKTQLGLMFNSWHKERIISERTRQIDMGNFSMEDISYAKERVKEVVDTSGTKYYIPSKTVMALSERIKITEKFDIKFLQYVKEKKVTFLLGDIFYRWVKTGGKINILACHLSKIKDVLKVYYPKNVDYDVSYLIFTFDTEVGSVSYPDDLAYPFTHENINQFLKLLIFTELSEIETVLLKPNQSKGTKRNGKVKNDTQNEVILIDSLWNKNIVITDEFLVSGHFRLQPKGVNRTQRELIWIDTYKKNGYKRNAGVLQNKN